MMKVNSVNEIIEAMVSNNVAGISVDSMEFDVVNGGKHAVMNIAGLILDEDDEGKKRMKFGDVGVAAYKEDKYAAKKVEAVQKVMSKVSETLKKFEDEAAEKNMNLFQLCAEYGYSNDTICDCIDLYTMAVTMYISHDVSGETRHDFAKKYAAVFSTVMKETCANFKASMFMLTTGREICDLVKEIADILVAEEAVKE